VDAFGHRFSFSKPVFFIPGGLKAHEIKAFGTAPAP